MFRKGLFFRITGKEFLERDGHIYDAVKIFVGTNTKGERMFVLGEESSTVGGNVRCFTKGCS